MSFRAEQYLKFRESGQFPRQVFFDEKSEDEIQNLFLEILYGGVHGLCFSLYEEGQKPGDIIGEAQIRRRMQIIRPYTRWIRSFSCIEGNEHIPAIAREFGLKTLVGAWLGKDKEKNQLEIDALIRLARQGLVDVAAVGNEVLYRKDLTEAELIDYIRIVKAEIPGIPVGYVDAYYEFTQKPAIADACDVILCNCYPFWEGTDFNLALQHMRQMYHQAILSAKGKKVIITETGWPGKGQVLGNAVPSMDNALRYFINTQLWSIDEDVDVFYFSSFDEAWKVDSEGDAGAAWGIWDHKGVLKYANESV